MAGAVAAVAGQQKSAHGEFLDRLVPAIRLDGKLHVGDHIGGHFGIVRSLPYETVANAQKHEAGFADSSTQQFYHFHEVGIHSSEELRMKQLSTESRRELLIGLVLDGKKLNEALWIVESSQDVVTSVRQHEPHKLAWHPVDNKATDAVDKIAAAGHEGGGMDRMARFFNSDLPPHVAAGIQWPEAGKFRRVDNDPLRAHFGHGQYAPRAKAMTPTGRESNRPRPQITNDHLDFLTHAASQAGEDESKWYDHIKPMVQHIFDSDHYKDSEMVMGLLAAGSPQTHPHLNVLKSMRAYRDLIQGKPLVGSRGETNNYLRAGHGLDLSGPKVNAYDKNIKGNFDIPTNDRHMKYVTLSDYNSGDALGHEHHAAISQAVGVVAQRLKWPVAQAQAALWHHHIRRSGANDPSFHEPNSPFRDYSTEYGGWLQPTDQRNPVQDYGQFMYHPGNLEALTHMKQEMDKHRLAHPEFSKQAGSSSPFLLSPSTHGGSTKYGADIDEPTFRSGLGSSGNAMIDLGNRDISSNDPVSGYIHNPGKIDAQGRQRPKKVKPVSFLPK
jgi:hypothetical protein